MTPRPLKFPSLLYCPTTFRLISSGSIRVVPLVGMRPTRDILYAKGMTANGDTLHVFVVHAPSRYGGERATRKHRVRVAETLARRVAAARIADERFLMEEDGRHGGLTPARNYRGRRYSEGFSDHLPLVVRFNLEVSD